MSSTYSYNPIDEVFVGHRLANMFQVKSISGGNQLWLPNPETDSGKGLISTLVDSARNTKGVVTAQKICRDQDKIELSWSFLSVEEWETMIEFWHTNFEFLIEYYSPVFHKRINRIFYIGDRSYKPFNTNKSGNPVAYVECTANVIDTGLSL